MGCCSTLTGSTKDCDSNLGGIKRIWIFCYPGKEAFTVTAGEVTAIADGTTLTEFEVRKNVSSYAGSFVNNQDTGSRYWTGGLTVVLTKMDTEKRLSITSIQDSDLSAIFQDGNDNYWLLGYDESIEMTDGTAETGTSRDDANQYTAVLTNYDKEAPYSVAPSVVTGLLTP